MWVFEGVENEFTDPADCLFDVVDECRVVCEWVEVCVTVTYGGDDW